MKKHIDIRFAALLIIATLLGIWRISTASMDQSEWSTFSPIGALALFGGAYFTRRSSAYLFPILVLLISDLVLMSTIYAPFRSGLLYDGWYWTYGSFALMVTVGEQLKNRVSFKNVFLGCLTAGLIHFVISNFGVWLGGCTNVLTGLPYPHTISGMLNCYIQAIPYFKTLLIGNFVFSALLFGGWELAASKFEVLAPKPIES